MQNSPGAVGDPQPVCGSVRETFPRSARLAEASLFKGLLRSKRSARGEFFVVQVGSLGDRRARLGIVVGKRTARRSVDRSLLKRVVREAFRREQSRLRGFDILVRPRRPLADHQRGDAARELIALLSQVTR